MKKLFNNFILIAGVLLYSANAAAICASGRVAKSSYISDETLYVQYDDTNPIIKAYTLTAFANDSFNFATSHETTCNASFIVEWNKANWPGNTGKTRASNIPGVGIEATFNFVKLHESSNHPYPLESTFYWGNAHQRFSTFQWEITLTRTGKITQEGIMKPGTIVLAYMKNNPTAGTPFNSDYLRALFRYNFRIVPLSCSLKNTSSTLNINMGDWFDTQFKNIGSASTLVAIPITLNCLAGTNIKVLITSSSYVDATTGKIGLSGNDKATGIAIQLLDKNNIPIELNKKVSIVNAVPVGDYALSWNARYIKTADNVTAGSANASATVNIIYE